MVIATWHYKIDEHQQKSFNDMERNKIICGDAVKVLNQLNENTVDLTVFSPPYDGLRDYNGYMLDLHKLGEALYRVMKDGGIVAMIIQDQTVKKAKTLTSFRTILDWCDNIGFRLFECNIYQKQGKDGAWWSKRFRVDHEYMPIFVKGESPRHFDKEHIKIPSKHAGKTMKGGANRDKNGVTQPSSIIKINNKKCIGTIWNCVNGGDKVVLKREHPATFPDKIPYNFISTFTKQGDLVLDPMVGSGSTAITAHILNRDYIGIDISSDYCKLARKRIQLLQTNMIDGFKNEKIAKDAS